MNYIFSEIPKSYPLDTSVVVAILHLLSLIKPQSSPTRRGKLLPQFKMRTSDKILNPSLKKEIESVFAQVVADLRDMNEAKTFLSDFFNESEFEAFAKRLAIAYWLKKKRSYNNIKDNLKVSSATIASVQSMLGKPGMELALKKVEAEEWANQWAERIKKFIK